MTILSGNALNIKLLIKLSPVEVSSTKNLKWMNGEAK